VGIRDAAASARAGRAPDGPAGAPCRQQGEGRAVLADTRRSVATLAEPQNSWEPGECFQRSWVRILANQGTFASVVDPARADSCDLGVAFPEQQEVFVKFFKGFFAP
jgi:hypothetical protein